MAFIPSDLPPPSFVQIVPKLHNQEASISVLLNRILEKCGKQQVGIHLPSVPPPLASIIKIPPPDSNKEVSYNELVCTEVDKQNIGYIILTMAENGKLSLLFKQGELKRIGAEINHVHPLKFLETIFSNPTLKDCMRDIHHDYFKWNGFMDGLVPSLNNHSDQGKLMQYVNEFAKSTNSVPEEIAPYFQSRDWESLVRYLMNR